MVEVRELYSAVCTYTTTTSELLGRQTCLGVSSQQYLPDAELERLKELYLDDEEDSIDAPPRRYSPWRWTVWEDPSAQFWIRTDDAKVKAILDTQPRLQGWKHFAHTPEDKAADRGGDPPISANAMRQPQEVCYVTLSLATQVIFSAAREALTYRFADDQVQFLPDAALISDSLDLSCQTA
eukprot:2902200-Amphidinium_carterae.3